MKLYTTLLLIASFSINALAQQDTLWFDHNWNKTTKDNAHYYRPPVKKETSSLYRINDYYLNGTLQMTGLSKFKDSVILEGKATWYRRDGKAMQTETYTNNKLNGLCTYYKYDTCKKNTHKKDIPETKETPKENCIYHIREVAYKDNSPIKEIIYDTDKKGAREEYFYKQGSVYKKLFYDTEGKLLGTYHALDFGNDYGTSVSYYKMPMRPKRIARIKDGFEWYAYAYYPNGQQRSSFDTIQKMKTYFDEKGKVIGTLQYKGELDQLSIYHGKLFKFYTDERTVKRIETYEAENLVNSKDFNTYSILIRERFYDHNKIVKTVSYTDDGKKLGEFTQKNGVLNGTLRNDRNQIVSYKNSIITKALYPYLNSKKTFAALKDSIITYYDTIGKPIATLKVATSKDMGVPDKLENGSYRPIPVEGTMLFHDHKNRIEEKTTFNNYKKTKKTLFNYRDDNCFRQDIIYNEKEKPIKHTFYFSNGNKRSELFYNPETEEKEKGVFFNEKGEQISEFDYTTQTGTFYEYHSQSDAIKEISTQKNGELVSRKDYRMEYDRSIKGHKNVLREVINANGESAFYSEQGTLIGKAVFKNGKPWSGVVYDKNSYRKYEVKEGKRHGKYIRYAGNGTTIKEEGQYLNDKKHGTFIKWTGIRTSYEAKNTKTLEKNYKNGVKDGYTITYDKTGKEISKVLYKDGKREGYATSYDKNTGKTYRLLYKNNEPYDGVLVDSYGNEKIYKDGSIVKDTRLTEIKFQNNYQNIKTVTTYLNEHTQKKEVFDLEGKRLLTYTEAYRELQGEVVQYSNNKPKYKAVFNNGELQEGTVWLKTSRRFPSEKYAQLSKQNGTVTLKAYNENQELLFGAEIVPKLYKDYGERILSYRLGYDLKVRGSDLLQIDLFDNR
ncbi:Antitoxin component YwqK of the YwqJK toxin-antitoxin module [Zobellia uliginosa]|uniref:Antitoxin component YwqK of the YwqJK toxin-antitoxin module n=1 Tax=Zobellia uliginosa TaxID=143224 RepID=A0ABY1KT24_9FLAO|nr:hypothetical protein [Zobellia uliginosa]SIS73418.1 Antitoxin component YwqK of the YwqJK toxin-antitoxin module [Zobellia uliginosa]